MLNKKIISFLKEMGWYDESSDKQYENALQVLGVPLETSFAYFNLYTSEITFNGRVGSIKNICWAYIYGDYDETKNFILSSLDIPSNYLPLDEFEFDGGFFYDKDKDRVIELNVGESLINFNNGIIDKEWGSFEQFLEWFFELG